MQKIPLGTNAAALTRNELPLLNQPTLEDSSAFYARSRDGEWIISTHVDRTDRWVRMLLLGPLRPTVVDIAIEIDGQPFREAREAWIDQLIAAAEDGDQPESEQDSTASETSAQTEAPTQQTVDEGEVDGATSEEIFVEAQGRKTRTLVQKLKNYLAANQAMADREEVRWLLAEWTGGPAQLTLGPAFAWRRADQAPLWQALDRDGDRTLDRLEIAQATDSLKQADTNRDDYVDLDELQKFAIERTTQPANSYPLVVVLDEQTDWQMLKQDLQDAYGPIDLNDANSWYKTVGLDNLPATNGQPLATAELKKLLAVEADFVYRVAFANEEATIMLLATNSQRTDRWQLHSATDQAITSEQQPTYIELTAVQANVDHASEDDNTADTHLRQTQIAIGAVVDGNSLLRLLDHDNNQRLSLREEREVERLLASLDRNHDQRIDESEIPTAIRLAVTRGPLVHQHLAKPTAAQRAIDKVEISDVPQWFAGMDRNGDGDLTRREFQGSPAQFAEFDRDGDGLISRNEAKR